MEGLEVGTEQWAGGCLDTGKGGTVGSEGGAEQENLSDSLESWAMSLGLDKGR